MNILEQAMMEVLDANEARQLLKYLTRIMDTKVFDAPDGFMTEEYDAVSTVAEYAETSWHLISAETDENYSDQYAPI